MSLKEKNALNYQSEIIKRDRFYLEMLVKFRYVSISFISRVCFNLIYLLSEKSYRKIIFLPQIWKICNPK